ncbi:hypothetical protein [Enterobacter hormaechei]|uniref:hypothetical protein n=1 Tax=Enterobacter hormaechei TaxID=158836 RepID=UPI001F4587C6|nr:hypothetical protein [Enterobacter hormaechei]
MSSKYEDLIKNARINADCGEHMSPEEVTTLLNVVETTFAALAAENAGLKKFCKDAAFDADYEAELGMERGGFTDALNNIKTPATDAFLAEVRAAAVDEVCLKISNAIVNCYQDEQIGLDAAATICGDFSSEIRKGVLS